MVMLHGEMKRRISEDNSSGGHYDKKFINEKNEVRCASSQKNIDNLDDLYVLQQKNDYKMQGIDQLLSENTESKNVLQPMSPSQGNEKISDDPQIVQTESYSENSIIKSLDAPGICNSATSIVEGNLSTKGFEKYVKTNNENIGDYSEIAGPSSDKKEAHVCCPGVHFLIIEGENEKLLSSLKDDRPKFIQELDTFLKNFKCSVPLKICCLNCKTGEMNDWNIFSLHLVGKNHRSKVRNNKNSHCNLLFCSSLSKICFYQLVDKNEFLRSEVFPEDVLPLIKGMFPNAKAKVNADAKSELRKVINIRKKRSHGVDVIFYDSSVTSCFENMFSAVDTFGKKYGMVLQALVFFQKDSSPPTSHGFAHYIRNINYGLRTSLYETFINGSPFTIHVVPNFDAEMETILEENIKNPSFYHKEWNVGSLTPAGSIFNHWTKLDDCVMLRMEAMDRASKAFFYITRQITNDIRKSIPGVKSVDYFGSRVTGLALPESDFDLQISIDEECSVNGIAKKCFYRNPMFFVKQVIGNAKVPILKLRHKKTQSMCDVSLNNFGGVVNSQLLRFYLKMDYRVKWLVALVKMWASMNLICGLNEFSSYSQAWLVLFFLMQKNISLVPCVKLLTTIKSTSLKSSLISEDTNTSFTLDMDKLKNVYNPAWKCKMTKVQLVTEFFKFCVEVLPSKNVLVPFTGEMISRDELREFVKALPSNYIQGNLHIDKNINTYSLIILDPIVQSCNISAAVSNRLDHIIQVAKETLALISNTSSR